MQEEKIKKYLIFTLLFQIIILFVGIVPTSSISIGDKLEIVILTNIGLLSGTIAVIYSINSKRLNFRHGYKNPRPHFCNRSTLIIHI